MYFASGVSFCLQDRGSIQMCRVYNIYDIFT